jgi:hypothetical protein
MRNEISIDSSADDRARSASSMPPQVSALNEAQSTVAPATLNSTSAGESGEANVREVAGAAWTHLDPVTRPIAARDDFTRARHILKEGLPVFVWAKIAA